MAGGDSHMSPLDEDQFYDDLLKKVKSDVVMRGPTGRMGPRGRGGPMGPRGPSRMGPRGGPGPVGPRGAPMMRGGPRGFRPPS